MNVTTETGGRAHQGAGKPFTGIARPGSARARVVLGNAMVMLILLLPGGAWAQTPGQPDQLFRQGLKHYAASDYQKGVEQFTAALEGVPASAPLDPALFHYNVGVGQYRLSQPTEAAQSFREALRTPDLALQGKTYFNLGNALYQSGQQTLNEGDVAGAFRLFQEASTNYMQSLRLQSGDHDAKVNFELSVLAQMRILQMVAMAMERLQQGEQLVDQYRFMEAAQWFQENLPMVEKALSIEPEMKKQFESMTERTSAVAEILTTPPEGGGP